MKIKVLSQLSVDKLRVLAKRELDILSIEFEKLVSDYKLELVDSYYDFDADVDLPPEGRGQDSNKDDSNCLLIARALPGLQEVHATDERLWTTLCLRDYREYAIARWPTSEEAQPGLSKHILTHWFAKGVRGLMRDNAVSRLWWYHQLCARVDPTNVKRVLDDLFLIVTTVVQCSRGMVALRSQESFGSLKSPRSKRGRRFTRGTNLKFYDRSQFASGSSDWLC